jgi:anionic cell wall polymer biosynthesis LytR-Cps2A-Psr (LCP) family protein
LAAFFAAPAEPKGSPSLAAVLSFLWPGLGQLYTRTRRTAVIFAVPAVLATALLLYALRRGAFVFGAQLFADRTVGLITVGLVLLVGAWRVVSVVHAFGGGEQRKERRILDRAVLGGLAAVIVFSHVAGGAFLMMYSNAGTKVFSPKTSIVELATPTHSLKPGETPGPTATPVPTPAIGQRVTILFTGVDSGTGIGRDETLYDSIMVVSYDPTANSVQMVSVPRDITNFPFYFGGVAPSSMRINALPTDVAAGFKSPDSPYMTLVNEVQFLIGIHIDYYAVMNLDGFVKMIDIVGGIDIVNPTAICDCAYGDPNIPGNWWPGYDWMDGSPYGFQLAAGPQHLDGRHALAYVRSRHSAGDNDFARQARQQQVLIALVHKMADPSQLLNLPKLIDTLASSITTTFPPDQVADYIAIAQGVPGGNFKQVVLDGDYFWGYLSSGATCLNYNKVADMSRQVFGPDSLWQGKADPADTCGTA